MLISAVPTGNSHDGPDCRTRAVSWSIFRRLVDNKSGKTCRVSCGRRMQGLAVAGSSSGESRYHLPSFLPLRAVGFPSSGGGISTGRRVVHDMRADSRGTASGTARERHPRSALDTLTYLTTITQVHTVVLDPLDWRRE